MSSIIQQKDQARFPSIFFRYTASQAWVSRSTLLLLLVDNASCRIEGHPSNKIKEFNKYPKRTEVDDLKT
jgi:hypothetical protein